jgi:hypothetical protein
VAQRWSEADFLDWLEAAVVLENWVKEQPSAVQELAPLLDLNK